MLSISGKGYSKIYSESPFYEEPEPKSFYHPTPQKQLSQAEKQLALSPKRPDGKKQQQQQGEQQSAEKKFLAGSHAIKPLASVQKYTPKSPSSSNFDESWPDSERPSSPSFTAGEDKSGLESLLYASVRKHAEPAFTSSPISADLQPSKRPGDSFSGPHSALMSAHAGRGISAASEGPASGHGGEKAKTEKPSAAKGRDGASKGGAEKGSVLQSYIERFRHGAPMSREERLRLEGNKKSEFWWLQSSPPAPNSTSTPKDGEGRSLPLTSQGRGGLTVENLRRRDDLDNTTDQLQQKAERLLESVGTSEPVVSTDGLGSTGSDVTGSSFSEPLVRPAFAPRESGLYPRQEKRGVSGVPRGAPHQDDILLKWRLQRKLEAAREGRYVAPDPATSSAPITQAEKEVEGRLAEFKVKLLQRGSVATTQIQESRVERAMKQIQSVMDTGVQTSPARPPPSQPDPPASLPSWSYSRKVDTSTQACSQDFPTVPSPANHDTPSGAWDTRGLVKSSAQQTQTPHKEATPRKASETAQQRPGPQRVDSEPRRAAGRVPDSGESERSVQYRQFLEAEKPHVHDGGDTPVKLPSPRRSDRDSAPAGYPSGADAGRGKGAGKNAGSEPTEPEQPSPQGGVQHRVPGGGGVHIPGDSGDAPFADAKLPHDASKKSRGRSRPDDNDVDSDNSSARSQPRRGNRRSQGQNGARETAGERDGAKKGAVPSPRQSASQANTRAAEAENSESRQAHRSTGELPGDAGEGIHRRSPDTADSGSRTPAAAQRRSGAERSQRSGGIMPPPQYSSSPARTSLSSAIGQVVHDRLFDLSGSVMSSVDSLSSSPWLARTRASAAESEGESDGEFESDSLLQVLRQQRQLYEAQLRCLDSILAERDSTIP